MTYESWDNILLLNNRSCAHTHSCCLQNSVVINITPKHQTAKKLKHINSYKNYIHPFVLYILKKYMFIISAV